MTHHLPPPLNSPAEYAGFEHQTQAMEPQSSTYQCQTDVGFPEDGGIVDPPSDESHNLPNSAELGVDDALDNGVLVLRWGTCKNPELRPDLLSLM